MNVNLVSFVGFCFVGLTTINRILEGQFITGSDVAIMNQMSITASLDLGLITVPVPNTNYIIGLFHMVTWDYSFFGGNAQLIQFSMYSVTFGLAVIFGIWFITMLVKAIRG